MREVTPRGGLLDRDAELAEMARFCSGPDMYWYWQAGPWAGKSALMAEFAVNPPSGVIVVSFFVTARYRTQNDSTAFAVAVLEQLEDLMAPGVSRGSVGYGGSPDSFEWALRAAARRCYAEGRCLVLVVDGLDEDRSAGNELPSIASLLPKHSEPGLKVLVSGRPHPALPPDVPPDHPLTGTDIAHELLPSRHAAVARVKAMDELGNLLSGTSVQRDVVGLIAAAGGGLSLGDLAHLTGLAPFDVEEVMRDVGGRSFATRAPVWGGLADSDRVYLLAHETLQAEAVRALGEQRISGYRERLHALADSCRVRGWPADTPVYLLRGYFQMLRDTEDLPRMVVFATDPDRHDRMMVRSGGDAAGLAEIATAQNFLLTCDEPDLVTMALLAAHRDDLALRNASIPVMLPAVWARVGQGDRAESLARSILPHRQAEALALVAQAAWSAGDHERAVRIADETETLARATHPNQRDTALVAAAMALAATAHSQRAAKLIRCIADLGRREEAQAAVAAALISTTLPAQADRLARSISDFLATGDQLARAAAGFVRISASQSTAQIAETNRDAANAIAEWHRQAAALAESARMAAAHRGSAGPATLDYLASTIEYPGAFFFHEKEKAFAKVAAVLAESGCFSRAVHFADLALAEDHARKDSPYSDNEERARIREEAIAALALAGSHQRAETLASAITEEGSRAEALARVATAMAAQGLRDHAARLAGESESLARAITSPGRQAEALIDLSIALAEADLHDRARHVASKAADAVHSLSDPKKRSYMLAAAAAAASDSGLEEQAAQLADEAESTARNCEPYPDHALALVAWVLAGYGMHDRAVLVARSVSRGRHQDSADRACALAWVAMALADAGKRDEAGQLAIEAAATLPGPDGARSRDYPLAETAVALAAVGQHEQAESVARSIKDDDDRATALADIATALALAGSHEDAERLASEAHTLARSLSRPEQRAKPLAHTAKAFAAIGRYQQAASLAQSITDSKEHASALRGISAAHIHADQHDQALAIARAIDDLESKSSALSRLARSCNAAGDVRRARRIAAEALAHGQWTRMVSTLGSLSPDALIMLAVHLLGESE